MRPQFYVVVPLIALLLYPVDTLDGSRSDAGAWDRISLGGTEIADDAASVRFVGQSYYGEGGALGTYQYIGDLSGDGIPDLAVAAPRTVGASQKKEDGKVFIFFGKGGLMDSLIDLEEVVPDITLWGNVTQSDQPGGNRMGLCLVSAIRAGDFDGDGDDDLAICAPTNNMSGLCYIIYNDSDHWPALIKVKMDDLFLYRQLFSNSQYAVLHNDMFVTSNEGPLFCTIIYGCGGYSTPTDDQVCDFFHVKDLDRDGIDDLIWGGMAGWTYHAIYQANRGNMRILWGRHPDRYDEDLRRIVCTYDLTCLDDRSGFYRYGMSMDIGDIDGDGWIDAIVGSPWTTSEMTGMRKAGAVHVYYNISRLNVSMVEDVAGNEGVLNHSGPVNISIFGSGEGDEFGKSVLLRDIDGDGKDEIIASAPYSDGPGRTNSDCGEIFVFKGRHASGFPKKMDAESSFDMMLVGPSGSSDRKGTGFRLGEMFRLGDINGDDKLDMVIAVKGLDLPILDNDVRYNAGAVLFYDHYTAFPPNSRIVQVSYPSGYFTLEGRDIEDVAGYHLELGDLDGDGIDDVVIGAPNADGLGNERTRAGEVYLLYSTSLRFPSLSISGPGFDKGSAFASGGKVRFEVPIMDPRSDSYLDRAEFRIGPGDDALTITIGPDGILSRFDPAGYLESADGRLEMPPGSEKGKAWVEIEFGWAYPWRSGNDISFRAFDRDGSAVHRTFRAAFGIEKDLVFFGDPTLRLDGRPMLGTGSWAGMGDLIEFGSLDIVYSGRHDRQAPLNDLVLEIIRGSEKNEIPYTASWNYADTIDSPPLQEYRIRMRLSDGMPSNPRERPVLGAERILSFRVDDTAPPEPSPVTLTNEGESKGAGGIWSLRIGTPIGPSSDNGGSGVKEYLLRDSLGLTPFLGEGGLMGTYYIDREFGTMGLQVLDQGVDYDWGAWGPHPEMQALPPSGFSIRWHGWIQVDDDGPYRFQLRGRGEGMMVLDGKTAIALDELDYMPESAIITIEPGLPHPVELYYRHSNTSVPPSFRFWWLDEKAKLGPVPYSVMYHPTNETKVEVWKDEDLHRQVVSMDWVGLMSVNGTGTAFLDLVPPRADLTRIPRWTNRVRPNIMVNFTDGEGTYVSGLDPDSVRYRVLWDGENFGTWVSEDIKVHIEREDEIVSKAIAEFSPELGIDFHGTIEVEASDAVGNLFRSDKVPIGVDVTPPTVEILVPGQGVAIATTHFTASVSSSDAGGSGVDLSSFLFRIAWHGEWVQWMQPDGIVVGGQLEQMLTLEEGNFNIQYSVSDLAGNRRSSRVTNFTVSLPPENMPPVPVISEPRGGAVFREGWPILLSAKGTHDDGLGVYDPVRMTWTSNISGYIGSGVRVQAQLKPGIHRITLFADDGMEGHNVSANVSIRVLGSEPVDVPASNVRAPRDDLKLLIVVLASGFIVLLGIALFAWRMNVKRRDKEVKMEIRPKGSAPPDLPEFPEA